MQCGEVVRAEMILSRMEQLSEAGESDICPTVVSYSTVINGYVTTSAVVVLDDERNIF